MDSNGLKAVFGLLLLALASATSDQEQSGSVTIDASSESSSHKVSVIFDGIGFSQVPSVFVWIETGVTGPKGSFRAVVDTVNPDGFTATVSRYDVSSGWDSSITLKWDAKVYSNGYKINVGGLNPEAGKTKTVRINFHLPYSTVPIVEAWTRGLARYPDTFHTKVSNIDQTGFDATISRTDSPDAGWSQDPTLYWTEKDTANHKASTTTLGQFQPSRQVNVPSAIWVYTPVLAETSTDVYDVLGREVHLSSVLNMLTNETLSFPVVQTEDRRMKIELTIRGDTVYIDDDFEFRGLKKLTVYSRKIVGNNNTVHLTTPIVCEAITGNDDECTYLGKASKSSKGTGGKSGVSTPVTSIYVHEIDGNLGFSFQASNGNQGEDGGDGDHGQDNQWEQGGLSHDDTCSHDCGSLFGEKSYKGTKGPDGGNGFDGQRGGSGGAGGDIGKISFSVEKVTGFLSVEQTPGTGGLAGDHGFGGRQGYGGTGGCGRICHNWLMCIITICWPECTSTDDCGSQRGDQGIDGQAGFDGYAVYPVPELGEDGATARTSLKTVSSLKNEFQSQEDLLSLIKRHGESMFQRNDNQEAEEIFTFLLSVVKENSTMYNQVAESVQMIQSGFDYYGNDEQYAPDLDWSYLTTRTDNLLQSGKAFEDAYNLVQDNINDIFTTTETVRAVASVSISAQDSELAHKESELKSQKNLYYKSLRQLERTMKGEVLQMNILVPLAVVQEEIKDLASGLPALIGGIGGFVGGLVHGDWSSAFQSATQALGVIFGRDKCDAPSIQEAAQLLQEKLEFGYEYERIQPEDLDFSTMDVSMVPEIMLSDLAKNKATLIKELECLYVMDNSGVVEKLDMVLDNFFRDAALRISLMDKLMNIDVQLKEINYNRDLLADTQATLDAVAQTAESSLSMDVKMSYTDLLFNLYQQEENTIMRSIYELSKSYQFASLWNFHALDKYSNYFSDEVMTTNLGSLQGIAQLQAIRQSLDDERNVFLNLISSSAGPASHVYTLFNQFDQDTSPDILSDLQSSGQFVVRISLDADDIHTTGCDNCYNQRLDALYVELIGGQQNSTVPAKLYLKVAHMGDSYFLVPTTTTSSGQQGKEVVLLQQSPESIDGGHVMSFDSDKIVSSSADPQLAAKFMKQEHKFCEDSNDFFTPKPCKSPYSTFVVTLPRNSGYECTLDPSQMISGTNCKDLDFTKFTSVRVYAKINSWSNYPARPDSDDLNRLIQKNKQQ